MTKLFFATDVHGSEICWKKFVNGGKFYEADIIILGGGMTGKAIVPIIAQGGDKYKVTLLDQETILEGQDEVDGMIRTIRDRGYYPYVTDPDDQSALCRLGPSLRRRTVDRCFAGSADAQSAHLGIRRRVVSVS